ncbi:MAG: HNH endonuclease [Acidimicrobiales bacterium]|nr:HNH endonuclease [Acidimicrobiales bacterium]
MFAWLRSMLQRRAERRHADAEARHNRDRGTHCFYCGSAFSAEPGLDRTVDHRLPRSHGGTDALVNMVFACRACNERKADRDEAEFLASEWLAERRRALGPNDGRH